MRFYWKNRRGALLCALGVMAAIGGVTAWGRRQERRVPLPTGQSLALLEAQTEVGSFPVSMALSRDGKWIAVTDTGFRQYLSILSSADGHLVSQLPFNTSLPDSRAKTALYVGLTFAPDSHTLYASRG